MFEANGKRIVLFEDIDYLCSRFSSLTDGFNDSLSKISNVLSNITDSYRRSGGKSTIVETCRGLSSNLFAVSETLRTGNELLIMAKNQTRNMDAVICDAIKNNEFSELTGFEYYEPTDSGTEVYASIEEYERIQRENDIINRYNNGEKVDIDSRDNMYCGKVFFEFSGGCTWYAAYRFKKVTNINLEFIDRCNAHDWDNCINRDLFNVNPTSDVENIVAPSVAVQEGGEYGHVVFIEAVRDGKVYFSESSYGNTGIAGRISCVSIEVFMNQFQSIITAK